MYEEDQDNIHLIQYLGSLEGEDHIEAYDEDDEDENVMSKVDKYCANQDPILLKSTANTITKKYLQ
jgi:hypothetical protein